MKSLFLSVVNMSITGSYVILFILAARLLLKKAPKKYSHALWAVAAFRLCCPVTFRARFSLFGLRPFDMTVVQPPSGGLTYLPPDIGTQLVPQIATEPAQRLAADLFLMFHEPVAGSCRILRAMRPDAGKRWWMKSRMTCLGSQGDPIET
jgi:hypothetical protein